MSLCSSSVFVGRRLAVVAVVTMLALTVGSGVVAAQSVDGTAGTVVVEADETVDSIDAVAGSIVVRGTVTGDVSGVAGHVHIAEGGQVDGSVETAAGAIRIDGTVAGDVEAGSGHLELGETAQIGGGLDVGTGYLIVDGQVDGDVQAGAERIALGPNAAIGGEFRYDAGSFSQDPAATVAGGVVQDSEVGERVGDPVADLRVPTWLGVVYNLLANLLLGAILLAVFPSFSAGVASRVADSTAVSAGVGLLALIAVPVVLVLFAVTIIGIPITLLGAVGFAALIWTGAVYGQYAVGAWVVGFTDRQNRWLALVVGLVGFAVLGSIPVLGGVLELIALLLGLGALTLGFRDVYRTRGSKRVGPRQTTLDDVPAT